MAKKKQQKPSQPVAESAFAANPFRPLKGFAVSGSVAEEKQQKPAEPEKEEVCPPEDDLFAREMAMLGVEHLDAARPGATQGGPSRAGMPKAKTVSDEQEFLAAMETLQVRREDSCLDGDDGVTRATPRRMKLLQQGRLEPEATLDLHGLYRHQVSDRVRFFLENARHQGFRTLLIVTGRGLHSEGGPVLRSEVEAFLGGDGRQYVAEWARAPRKYGGDGALVVFLKDS